MLFKVSYTRHKHSFHTYIYAEDANTAADYLTEVVHIEADTITTVAPISSDDPDFTKWHEAQGKEYGYYVNEPYRAPMGWITHSQPDLPRKYFCKTFDSVNRDYTLLRWAATPGQIVRMGNDWTEITAEDAAKMAREAAKWQKNRKYPRGWQYDDEYVYPSGYVPDDDFHKGLLHYHKSTRTADYTPNVK